MAAQYDIAIIGAGHNGLVAATYLARAGRRVLLLERRDIVGGACATEEPLSWLPALQLLLYLSPAPGESDHGPGTVQAWL